MFRAILLALSLLVAGLGISYKLEVTKTTKLYEALEASQAEVTRLREELSLQESSLNTQCETRIQNAIAQEAIGSIQRSLLGRLGDAVSDEKGVTNTTPQGREKHAQDVREGAGVARLDDRLPASVSGLLDEAYCAATTGKECPTDSQRISDTVSSQ